MAEKLLLVVVVAIVFFFVFTPGIRQLATQVLTSSERITVPVDDPTDPSGAGERQLELVTLLGFDAIPAILDPEFVSVEEAERWMDEDEQVLALSINGDSRAYSIRMLSRHEIVNDVVGGKPVAVTW